MLRIYPIILEFVTEVSPLVERIGRSDPDLAKQLRRASASVVLNTAEGMYARGGSRVAARKAVVSAEAGRLKAAGPPSARGGSRHS